MEAPRQTALLTKGTSTVPATPCVVGSIPARPDLFPLRPQGPGPAFPSTWLLTLAPRRPGVVFRVLLPQDVSTRDRHTSVDVIYPVSGVLCVATAKTPGQGPSSQTG